MAIVWSSGDVWIASTVYAATSRAVNVGNVYVCTIGGTSAGSGGPTGTGAVVVDGSVTWKYLGAYAGYFATGWAPELLIINPPTLAMQAMYLSLAEKIVADPCAWIGGLLDPGQAMLAAHFGELAALHGRGPVTSEAVGPISQANAALMGERAYLLTIGGRAYLDLTQLLPTVFGLVI